MVALVEGGCAESLVDQVWGLNLYSVITQMGELTDKNSLYYVVCSVSKKTKTEASLQNQLTIFYGKLFRTFEIPNIQDFSNEKCSSSDIQQQ